MRKFRRSFLQAATIVCVFAIAFTLIWKPVAEAQRDIKRDVNAKFEDPEAPNSEVEVLDISHLVEPQEPNAWTKPVTRHLEIGQNLGEEEEPNGTTGTATQLLATEGKIEGSINPNGDIDFFSFAAPSAGRIYVATQTVGSASGSQDSVISVIGTDGTTVLETDDNDGTFGATSSSISGLTLGSAGTYFIRVQHFSATSQIRPYHLYFAFRTGSPTPETEPNGTPAEANAVGGNGEMSGAITPATDTDFFSFALNAGDTVFLSLNSDPERDNVQWNGRLGFGLFGTGTPNQILVANDTSVGSASNPLSEAFFFTVKDAGVYYAYVDEPAAALGNTYTISGTVIPSNSGGDCTTYTSTDVPKTIGPGIGLVSSQLTVPGGSRRIDSAEVFLDITHTRMVDLDVGLLSPRANENGLFTDVGAASVGAQTGMNVWIDDEAAIPFVFQITEDYRVQPEIAHRLEFFNGEDPTGVWRLDIRDDLDAEGGTLNNWGIRICQQPAPSPNRTTIFETNFEANDGGFTHSGTLDEWEWGTPTTPATNTSPPSASFLDCASGTKCWKTDLDNTYDASSNQDLDSPVIFIPLGATEVELSWMMRYQLESSSFDHGWIEVRPVGNPAGNKKIGEWDGATMTYTAGNPTVNIGQSAGWGLYTADITGFAGQSIVVRFHLDSDTTIQLGGLAIDDVKVSRAGVGPSPSTISGKLQASNGRPVTNAFVTLTEQNGTKWLAITNSFGYFRFLNIMSQQNITLSVRNKRYTFTDHPLFVTGDSDVLMVGALNP